MTAAGMESESSNAISHGARHSLGIPDELPVAKAPTAVSKLQDCTAYRALARCI